jgi:DNA-binding NarL/FixJ family response regulator
MNPPVKIVLVEDHEMVREMLAGILVDDLKLSIAGTAATVAEGMDLCLRLKPDLVVFDWMLPDGRGFDIVRSAGAKLARTRWLCLSANEQEHLVIEATDLGVHGFVMKRSGLPVLREAITTVLAGRSYYCATSSRLLVEAMRSRTQRLAANLTLREREVLQGIARGENTKEIAGRLRLEQKTVHNHLASVKDKLGIREPAGLVRYAIKHGFVEAP